MPDGRLVRKCLGMVETLVPRVDLARVNWLISYAVHFFFGKVQKFVIRAGTAAELRLAEEKTA